MFGVPKDVALKMAIKSNYILQNNFNNFYKSQLKTGSAKIGKMTKISKKSLFFVNLGLKIPKNDLLTLNYGLLSSFTTLST